MRCCVLVVLLAAATALAVPQKGSLLRFKTRSGAIVMGELVSENAEGFTVKNGQKTVVVKFADIVEMDELSSADPSPTQPAPPPPPPPPAVVDPNTPCAPECRDGFVCTAGRCVSACNPPCGDGEECRGQRCVDPEREAELKQERTRADQLAALKKESEGLHFGAQVNVDSGTGTFGFYVLLRAAAVANYRLGILDLRASAGPLVTVPTGFQTSAFGGGTFDLEARLLLGSRFALGVGGRAGLVMPTVQLPCTGPGCDPDFTRGQVTAGMVGGRVLPAIFRLGARRSFELAVAVGYERLLRSTGELFLAGLQLDYVFF